MVYQSEMEAVSALLQLVDDDAGATLGENELLARLETIRRQLRGAGDSTTTLAACHVTTQTVAYLVTTRPGSKWNKRVFLSETMVTEAAASLRMTGRQGDNLCGTFKAILNQCWETAGSPKRACVAAVVLTRLGVLLACCWLMYDRVGKVAQTIKLLTVISEFCLEHEATGNIAKRPMLLLAMVHLVERKQYQEAMNCFREVEAVASEEAEVEGVFQYWYAVALICSGLPAQAAAKLDKCIERDYQPVSCLTLQTLIHLHTQDLHAAGEKLQRALEINFSKPECLYNYACFLGRMENFQAQQQMLEYLFEILEDGSEGGRRGETGSEVALFDGNKISPLFASRATTINVSTARLQLAIVAMENGRWQDSKQHFDEYFCGDQRKAFITTTTIEATRDYIYVLLQCNLPSEALSKCTQFLKRLEDTNRVQESEEVASILLLHFYKADALLCLERVDECCRYLSNAVQPMAQDAMMQLSDDTGSITMEVKACHTQLLNNLAVVTACQNGIDAAIKTLSEGLQLYPKCLTLTFNLVLLLWRKGEKTAACATWVECRGWSFTKTNDLQASTTPREASPSAIVSVFEQAAAFAQKSSINEHVQGDALGEGSVSAEQLTYLDALILNYWRDTRSANLVESSLQYVEYLESFGSSSITRQK